MTTLLGILYVLAGSAKFHPGSPWPEMFRGWGYPAGSHVIVGALEVAGGILLLVPRTARYAAYLLATIMTGAAATHIVHGPALNVGVTAGLAVVTLLLSHFHRGRQPGASREKSASGA